MGAKTLRRTFARRFFADYVRPGRAEEFGGRNSSGLGRLSRLKTRANRKLGPPSNPNRYLWRADGRCLPLRRVGKIHLPRFLAGSGASHGLGLRELAK